MVEKTGVIVIGHVRRLAAIKLKLTEVPVHVADNLTPSQIRALRCKLSYIVMVLRVVSDSEIHSRKR